MNREEAFNKLRNLIQNALGAGYTVSPPDVVAETPTEGAVGFVVTKDDGTELSYAEIHDLLEGAGITMSDLSAEMGIEGIGMVFPPENTPDALDDATVGALDPATLNEHYGPHAADFVDQLAALLALEWAEVMESEEIIVSHLKSMGLEHDQAGHMMEVIVLIMMDILLSRQHLGATLEGYRRDHELDLAALETLMRTATQRVLDGAFEEDSAMRSVTNAVRSLYHGEQAWRYSWPPVSTSSFEHYWNEASDQPHS